MLLWEPKVEGWNEPRLYRVVATGDMNRYTGRET